MPPSYNEPARESQSPASIGFRSEPPPQDTESRAEKDTRLVEEALQNLLQWGVAGARETLDAYRALVSKLPNEKFPVELDRNDIASMRRRVEGLDGQLAKTIQEVDSKIRECERGLGALARVPENGTAADERARLSGHRKVIEDLKTRRGLLRSESEKLRFERMIPKSC